MADSIQLEHDAAPTTAQPDYYLRELRWSSLLLWGVAWPFVFLLWAACYNSYYATTQRSAANLVWLALSMKGMALLYPLLAFSAAGLVAHTFAPRRFACEKWVSVAIASGCFLWGEMWIAWCVMAWSREMFIGGVMASLLFVPIFGLLGVQPFAAIVRLATRPKPAIPAEFPDQAVPWLVLCACVVLIVPVLAGIVIAMALAPPLALWTYGYAAYERRLPGRPSFQIRLGTMLLWVGALSLHLAAWRYALIHASSSPVLAP